MNTGITQIRRVGIYAEKSGSGDPLIFLHADSLDHRQWVLQAEFFSEKYTVYCIDLRGFGKSDNPGDTPYSYAGDVRQVMDDAGMPAAHIVGLSLGAAVGIDLALEFPDRVRSLVLADAGISGDGFDDGFTAAIAGIIAHARSGEIEEAKKIWLGMDIFSVSRSLAGVWDAVTRMVEDYSGYKWSGTNQSRELHPPALGRLHEISVPTHVIVGEFDAGDFQRKSRILLSRIQGSSGTVIPRAGHLSNMDNPDAYNHAVDAFLSQV